MNDDFDFNMLSRKQLLKLCSYYNLKIQGSMPNYSTSDDDLQELVRDNLKVLEDGTIAKKDNKAIDSEVKLLGGSKIRMIII